MSGAAPLHHLGLLASHRGTNLQAVIDACRTGRLPAEARVVISNNRESGALVRAREAGIPAYHLSRQTHAPDAALDAAILEVLLRHGVGLVVLAGYMKRLGGPVLARFRDRVVNIHPALLPRYGGAGMFGLRVHEAVLAAGETESGATVHLVDEHYDHGRILAQRRVPVLAADTPGALAERVLACEHALLIETLADLCAGRIAL